MKLLSEFHILILMFEFAQKNLLFMHNKQKNAKI